MLNLALGINLLQNICITKQQVAVCTYFLGKDQTTKCVRQWPHSSADTVFLETYCYCMQGGTLSHLKQFHTQATLTPHSLCNTQSVHVIRKAVFPQGKSCS